MKIVGKTDTGFLVQIAEDEIGILGGFGRHPTYGDRKEEFAKLLKTDTEIRVYPVLSFLDDLERRRLTVTKTANDLRELAGMLERSVEILKHPEPSAEG